MQVSSWQCPSCTKSYPTTQNICTNCPVTNSALRTLKTSVQVNSQNVESHMAQPSQIKAEIIPKEENIIVTMRREILELTKRINKIEEVLEFKKS